MLGRLKYHATRLAQTDPVLIYYRDVLRPRILKTTPLAGTTDESAELHVLTSKDDWLNLIWSLKSFYAQVDRSYKLTIHGDPTLPDDAAEMLEQLFPDARLILQSEARDVVLDNLSSFPLCRALREKNTLSIKVFDFLHYLTTDQMILFDSDLLFFHRPTALLERLEPKKNPINAFNRDVATAYAIPREEIEAAGFEVIPEVNSGFGVIQKKSMPLEWLEEFLSIPGLIDGHPWRIEQTLYALCATRYGVALFPDDYRVFLDGELGAKPFRHYVGAIRNQMYKEGVRKLSQLASER